MAAQAKDESAATPSEESQEEEEDTNIINAVVSKLPTRQGWSQSLVLYKNYWINPLFVQGILRLHTTFKPRHDDIILASNPKCGTTWMKALTFTITNRSRYELGNNDHPLLSRHPQELVPSLEIFHRHKNDDGLINSLEALPSPRLLPTHMPLSLFPPLSSSSIAASARIVYVCREPKDAFVSLWHFVSKYRRGGEHSTDNLESALDMFIQGFSPYGPFWDHCLEYWRQSISSSDNILFLKYEDMMSEPVKHVVRLATFLGVPFSVKEEEDGVPEEVVRFCSFDNLSSIRVNKSGEFVRVQDRVVDKSSFFRKGVVGDWVNHMSEEMGTKIDRVMEEKLKGSGLVL